MKRKQPADLRVERRTKVKLKSKPQLKPKSKPKTTFLDLPRELRLQIYDDALPESVSPELSDYTLCRENLMEFNAQLVTKVKTLDSLIAVSETVTTPLFKDDIDLVANNVMKTIKSNMLDFGMLNRNSGCFSSTPLSNAFTWAERLKRLSLNAVFNELITQIALSESLDSFVRRAFSVHEAYFWNDEVTEVYSDENKSGQDHMLPAWRRRSNRVIVNPMNRPRRKRACKDSNT